MAVKYTIWFTPVKGLCQLLMCESGVFDLLSRQQPEVELPRFPSLPTDLHANTHTHRETRHSMYSFYHSVSELLLMLKVSKEKCHPSFQRGGRRGVRAGGRAGGGRGGDLLDVN